MTDVILGLIAIVAGAVFCFNGYLAMRIVIPIWGLFVGFGVGAGAISAITGDGFLAEISSWIVGAIVALVFGALAYFFYEVAITIAMGGIGFLLGAGLMVALDVTWTWVIVLVGVLVGMALAGVAIVGNLPMFVLVVLTAMGGSTAVVGGLMLLFGSIESSDLDEGAVVAQIQDGFGWWLLYTVLVVLGIVSQAQVLRHRPDTGLGASTRDQWRNDGGNPVLPLPAGPSAPPA